jgi:hypothetical protein
MPLPPQRQPRRQHHGAEADEEQKRQDYQDDYD